jgi:hypothetical protein
VRPIFLGQIVSGRLNHACGIFDIDVVHNITETPSIVWAKKGYCLRRFELRSLLVHVQKFTLFKVRSFHVRFRLRVLLRLTHTLLQLNGLLNLKTVSYVVITYKVIFTNHYWLLI